MGGISVYTAQDIEKVFKADGLEAARTRYTAWYIKTRRYAAYRADCDTILSTDGYGDCIVEG